MQEGDETNHPAQRRNKNSTTTPARGVPEQKDLDLDCTIDVPRLGGMGTAEIHNASAKTWNGNSCKQEAVATMMVMMI